MGQFIGKYYTKYKKTNVIYNKKNQFYKQKYIGHIRFKL